MLKSRWQAAHRSLLSRNSSLLKTLTWLSLSPVYEFVCAACACPQLALPLRTGVLRQSNLANLLYGLRIMGLQPGQEWVQRSIAQGDAFIARAQESSCPPEGGVWRGRPNEAKVSGLRTLPRLVWGMEPLSQEAHQRWLPVLQRLEQQQQAARAQRSSAPGHEL